MSRTTDYILEEEAKGNIVFNGKEYEYTPDIQQDAWDDYERAHHDVALANSYLEMCKVRLKCLGELNTGEE